MADPDDLLTPTEAGHLLRLSADSVRVLSDKGALPTLRTLSGRRLFRRRDVERLAEARRHQKAQPIQRATDAAAPPKEER